MVKVAVLGAGLTGRLLALLLEEHAHVSLFEKHGLNDSSTTGRLAAAMVAPTAESVIASDSIVQMGRESTRLWPALLNKLGCAGLYEQKGTLVVAHNQDQNDLAHFQQRLKQLEQTSERVQTVSREEIQQLEPELSNTFSHGLLLEQEGHVDNGTLYDVTETRLLQSSVVINTSVEVVTERHSSGKYSVQYGENNEQFDWVFDCRGLGAKQELSNTQARLRGVRGEVARIRAPEVTLTRPIRMMHPRYPLYIAPKPNHEFVIGATEIESEDDKSPTVRSAMELLSAAYSVHKGFAEAEIISLKSGLRPTLLDNEPEISLDSNLIQINGLYRHGYLISPYVLRQALKLLERQSSLHNLDFSADPYQFDAHLVNEVLQ